MAHACGPINTHKRRDDARYRLAEHQHSDIHRYTSADAHGDDKTGASYADPYADSHCAHTNAHAHTDENTASSDVDPHPNSNRAHADPDAHCDPRRGVLFKPPDGRRSHARVRRHIQLAPSGQGDCV